MEGAVGQSFEAEGQAASDRDLLGGEKIREKIRCSRQMRFVGTGKEGWGPARVGVDSQLNRRSQ